MSDPDTTPRGEQKVWRYLRFSRFLWLIQQKHLWFARADTLGDEWELALTGDQLEFVRGRHPINTLDSKTPRESAIDRAKRIQTIWQTQTYISSWNASEHESHALWRVYCGENEGIAIQTTAGKLQAALADILLVKVSYEAPNKNQTPHFQALATTKRPMFAYESEVRAIARGNGELGYGIEWKPEEVLESIHVHPEADKAFMEAVVAAVQTYVPGLMGKVVWSAMREKPPLT